MFFENNKDDSLYKELGLESNATSVDIKKAYKKMALKYHPDRNKDPDAEEKFKKVSKAYDVLGDKEKKDSYDKFGLNGINAGGPGMSGGNPFDIFDNIFGGRGGFNNMGRTQNSKRTRGKNVVKEIDVELIDIYNEEKLKLGYTNNIACRKCNGSGCKEGKSVINCKNCDGTGMFIRVQQFGPGMISQSSQPCHVCRGKGKIINDDDLCEYCKGSKVEKKKHTLSIKLSKTTKKGDKIAFDGKADYDPDVLVQGDLIIVLNEKNSNKDFTRIGNDLVYLKQISLVDALCGMNLIITHLDNRKLLVKTSEVIQPDSVYKIIGEGMSGGDLFIKFKVVFPNKISDERKTYIKKIIGITGNNENSENLENHEIKFLDNSTQEEEDNVNINLNKLNTKSNSNSFHQSRFNPYDDVDVDDTPGCVHQ